MNAFYEHHQDRIRFGYRCLIGFCSMASSTLSAAERVIGFFNTIRISTP